ncbi:hypothetical protein SAY86_028789 [Trapa natans]|uniref:Uncharacterized protein n=1 Tax=Trapa natans TaxID=22666 RepID=A0AAN7MJA7_TRANT|nr:hypothetical protein SAY86_028789 [Trapa natans]
MMFSPFCKFRWSAIAAKLPGRTDNEIKNVWHTHLKKRLQYKQNGSSSLSPKCEFRSRRKSEPSRLTSAQHMATSPQPSSSEVSSITQTFITAAEKIRLEVKCEQPDISTESFPLIDESFWTDPMSSVSSGESSESDPSALSRSMEQMYFPIDISDGKLLWDGNHGTPNIDGSMDFWYNLLVCSGDL